MEVFIIIEIALFAIIFGKVLWWYLIRDKQPTSMEVLIILLMANILNYKK